MLRPIYTPFCNLISSIDEERVEKERQELLNIGVLCAVILCILISI